LIDNTQFKFGQTLKPGNYSSWHNFVEECKKFFVTKIKGYDPDKMCAATVLYEGDKEE
jgi:alkyldihydroxyacetonephosphate synthase